MDHKDLPDCYPDKDPWHPVYPVQSLQSLLSDHLLDPATESNYNQCKSNSYNRFFNLPQTALTQAICTFDIKTPK